ncbi:MAG: hypothetical protein QNL53_06310 [Microbacteriaceae bacterium]
MKKQPRPGLTLGVSVMALASSAIPILAIALGLMGIVLSNQLIRTDKEARGKASGFAITSRVLSILALVITVGLMAAALPVVLAG